MAPEANLFRRRISSPSSLGRTVVCTRPFSMQNSKRVEASWPSQIACPARCTRPRADERCTCALLESPFKRKLKTFTRACLSAAAGVQQTPRADRILVQGVRAKGAKGRGTTWSLRLGPLILFAKMCYAPFVGLVACSSMFGFAVRVRTTSGSGGRLPGAILQLEYAGRWRIPFDIWPYSYAYIQVQKTEALLKHSGGAAGILIYLFDRPPECATPM